MFNGPFSAIILEYFDGSCGDNYLLGTIFPYLESLHFSKYGVLTVFVWDNPFSSIRSIN
jgi:hypothetical protein